MIRCTRAVAVSFVAVTAFTVALTTRASAQQSRIESDTALASMIAAEKAFSQHSLRSGAQGAFLTYMAEDGLLYRPRAVKALTWLRARPMQQALLLGWQPVFADISAAGDLGYTTGPWIASSRQERGAQPTFGEFVTIWRRQDDGGWKAELHAGIAHAADPVGPGMIRPAPASQWRRPSAQQAAALASLLAADSAFDNASRAEGVVTAFQKRATAHVRLLRHGRFPLLADSASAFIKATPGYTWKPAGGAVARSGDLGYTYGVYAVMTDARGSRALETGDYVRVWRRSADGAWRVALDLTSPSH